MLKERRKKRKVRNDTKKISEKKGKNEGQRVFFKSGNLFKRQIHFLVLHFLSKMIVSNPIRLHLYVYRLRFSTFDLFLISVVKNVKKLLTKTKRSPCLNNIRIIWIVFVVFVVKWIYLISRSISMKNYNSMCVMFSCLMSELKLKLFFSLDENRSSILKFFVNNVILKKISFPVENVAKHLRHDRLL